MDALWTVQLQATYSYFTFTPSIYIFMFHVLKQPQLSVGPLGMDDRLKWSGQLLYGHTQPRFGVKGRATTKRNQINKMIV